MARQAAATRRPAPKAPVVVRSRKAPRLKLDGLSAEQQIAQLTSERERLFARVVELEEVLGRMRARQSEVEDRITWALDTLNDLLAAKD